MTYLSGEDRNQILLMPPTLNEVLSKDHPVRIIDAFVDSLDLNELTGESNNETPSGGYHPYDMFKLYLYGYLNNIKSSRNLERECKRNIELFWLLKKLHPNHSTIARFRAENLDLLKTVFIRFITAMQDDDIFNDQLSSLEQGKFTSYQLYLRKLKRKKGKERDVKLIEKKVDNYMQELKLNDNNIKPKTTSFQDFIKYVYQKLPGM